MNETHEKKVQDFKAISLELKELNKKRKEIKEVAKKEGIKLVAERGKKDRIPEYDILLRGFEAEINTNLSDITEVFKNTKSLEKPQGQKWVIFTLQGDYSFAILNNNVKVKKDE